MKKGLNHLHVHENVGEAWNRLLSILQEMQIPVFMKTDHKANAASAGLDMKEARVVSFGNPAVGTLLMQQSLEAALELPLKILVWESPAGTGSVPNRIVKWWRKCAKCLKPSHGKWENPNRLRQLSPSLAWLSRRPERALKKQTGFACRQRKKPDCRQ